MDQVCNYCGEKQPVRKMNRVKVGVGPDLYFCKERSAGRLYSCSKEVRNACS